MSLAESLLQHLLSSLPAVSRAGGAAATKSGKGRKRKMDKAAPQAEAVRALWSEHTSLSQALPAGHPRSRSLSDF